MRFGSVCSGIEAASVAWHPLGWEAAWLAEIEPFPSAVLKHHYPDVPNYGDMTALPDRIRNGEVDAPDLFCGGTPCQAFSVAGKRQSLADARGNLSLTFCDIADAIDESRSVRGLPATIVFWENVPGVLSTGDNAFGCFLAQLCGGDEPLYAPDGWPDAGCVSGPSRTAAWRILDAQYFGLAQRRRRVFVVASAREGFDPAAVLFEFDGVRRDTAPSRQAGQGVARGIEIGPSGGRFTDLNPTLDARAKDGPIRNQLAGAVLTSLASVEPQCFERHDQDARIKPISVAPTLSAQADNTCDLPIVMEPVSYDLFNVTAPVNRQSRQPVDPCHTLARANAEHAAVVGFDAYNNLSTGDIAKTLDVGQDHHHVPLAFHPTQDPISSTEVCRSLGANENATAAVVQAVAIGLDEEQNARVEGFGTLKARMDSGGFEGSVMTPAMQVRRLTPVECERLQGFPDNYTAIPWRGKDVDNCPDGPRYKALGNSWAVPVVRWIGKRIDSAIRSRT